MRTCAFAGLLALGLAATAAAAFSADSLDYDDPGMHYRAPEGWQRLDPSQSPTDSDAAPPPAAEFAKDFGKGDRRAIAIEIRPYDGDLERLLGEQETALRGGDDVRIFGERHTTLGNGMPAYWLCADAGSDLPALVRRCEYVVYDGTRSIIALYIGRQGFFEADEAQRALSSLYVVLYPKDRR